MKPVHQVLFAVGLLLLGTITWRIVTQPKPQATWLEVVAPARVRPGDTLTLRVTLTTSSENLQLTADLHGWTRRNQPLRTISHTRSQVLVPSVRNYEFHLRIPELPDLATVRAIIYLSPDGDWKNQIHAVTSDEIEILAASAAEPDRTLKPLGAHEQIPDPVVPRIESTPLHHVIASLWLIIALVLARRLIGQPAGPAPADSPAQVGASLPLLGGCVAAFLFEVLHLENLVGDAARNLALEFGYYEERLVPQQIGILVLVVSAAAVSTYILMRTRNRRIVLGLLAYAALAAAAALSLHETDAVLYARFLGQPVEQLAKMIAVGVSVWGLLWSVRAPAAGSG